MILRFGIIGLRSIRRRIIEGQGERYGVRTVSIGEKPFFDAESKSRREDLAEKFAAVTA
jgi:hypothetical protein